MVLPFLPLLGVIAAGMAVREVFKDDPPPSGPSPSQLQREAKIKEIEREAGAELDDFARRHGFALPAERRDAVVLRLSQSESGLLGALLGVTDFPAAPMDSNPMTGQIAKMLALHLPQNDRAGFYAALRTDAQHATPSETPDPKKIHALLPADRRRAAEIDQQKDLLRRRKQLIQTLAAE